MAGYKCFSVFFLKKYQAAGKQNYRISKKYKKNEKLGHLSSNSFLLLTCLLFYCTVELYGAIVRWYFMVQLLDLSTKLFIIIFTPVRFCCVHFNTQDHQTIILQTFQAYYGMVLLYCALVW
jgi:hypothetical protein